MTKTFCKPGAAKAAAHKRWDSNTKHVANAPSKSAAVYAAETIALFPKMLILTTTIGIAALVARHRKRIQRHLNQRLNAAMAMFTRSLLKLRWYLFEI